MMLSNIEVGKSAKIKSVKVPRLVEMGFVRGAVVKVIRRAPLGEPIEIEIKGYNISLRESEAEKIEVEPI